MTKRNSTGINPSNQVIKRTVLGVGFNSGGYYPATINRKSTKDYQTWRGMINRAYNKKYHEKRPTYIQCTVSDEWHDYQKFAAWLTTEEHYSLGYELDKDLLIRGNKIYSSETCCLVPREINILLTDSGASRGEYPQGVSFVNNCKKYRARLNVYGNQESLGLFDCPKEAHCAYIKAKERHVKTVALLWKGRIALNVFDALMVWTVNT